MNKGKWQQGFLMIDALLGIVIISVALVGIMSMFSQSTKATRCSAGYTTASHLGQAQMELLKKPNNLPNIKAAAIDDKSNTIKITDHSSYVTPPTGFSIISTAKQNSDFPGQLAEVTVTVNWDEQNKTYSMPFTTFFSAK